jgi:ATP adenylyltransferase
MADRPPETAGDFAGDPDGFGRLWTPHRMVYIQGENKPEDASESECPFCRAAGRSDEDGLIVARGAVTFAVLNLYPYNSGHLMLVPYRHVADYTELTEDEVAEVAAMTRQAIRTIRAVFAPQGFNVGLNQGPIAGAGIAAHLHQHVVPRWGGDTNFMPVVAHTRVLPQLLADARSRLAEAWPGE